MNTIVWKNLIMLLCLESLPTSNHTHCHSAGLQLHDAPDCSPPPFLHLFSQLKIPVFLLQCQTSHVTPLHKILQWLFISLWLKPNIWQGPTILYFVSWLLVTSLTSCSTLIPCTSFPNLAFPATMFFSLHLANHIICCSPQPGPLLLFPLPRMLFFCRYQHQ